MLEPEFDLFFPDLAQRRIEYNARASVPDFDACVQEYADLSARARALCPGLFDLSYGPAKAEKIDLFPVPGSRQPGPVFVFIHGGYWRSQSKTDAALMARTFTDAGIAVAVLEYTLLPIATLAEVVREMRSAIAWLFRNGAAYGIDPHRIHLGGSSAGAHLVGMLLADGWQDEFSVPADVVAGAVGLSGLYDIRPICDIEANDWLRLVPEQAERLSPLFHIPDQAPPLVLSVGGLETEGFKRQTAAYAAAWKAKGHDLTMVPAPARNHFNLLVDLSIADAALTRAVFEMIESRK
ncbi:alpha/beta hydrolase [Pararhodobacter aggregans]|uniref:Esterase n=1 Tax=Pararhodobacter aggregans TaxID=404875 RepID=A0A2T7UKX2_9RHOB|nr:alpha/beta hydrolase [Pararhodobacter aggregans]PTX02369.1 arylformamidase [Pararhodobacter aggregans]PVE45315.1 esterase [Pararhodobacter aggregans]